MSAEAIPLACELRPGAKTVTGRVSLTIRARPTAFDVTVPTAPAPVGDLLPIFRGLTNELVRVAEVDSPEPISCCAGCGACCRQLVPVAEPETRALAKLVERLPEPRQSQVKQRFADALAAFESAGILDRLRLAAKDGPRELGLDYFAAKVPCPFLEDESCSIHPDRPLACREYLVTSSAENCSAPTAENIRMVPVPGKASVAVMRQTRRDSAAGWVPLVLALEFAAAHPTDSTVTGPETVQAVFKGL